jgi:DnaJ-class molecular chaperone
MRTCPQCDGEGVCAYEEAVVDYENGGYLEEVIDTCDMCHGSGEVDDEEENEQ